MWIVPKMCDSIVVFAGCEIPSGSVEMNVLHLGQRCFAKPAGKADKIGAYRASTIETLWVRRVILE